jgi:hypothetical protein
MATRPMAALLYFLTGIAVLAAARSINPISWRAGAFLLALPLILTGHALLTEGVFAPLDLTFMAEPLTSLSAQSGVTHVMNPGLSDMAWQFIPWKAAVRFALAHGQWPLWNPFELCGDPLAGAMQSAPFHPVSVIGYLLPLDQAITFEASMTLLLAALSMFLFLREPGEGSFRVAGFESRSVVMARDGVPPQLATRNPRPGLVESEIAALFGAATWMLSINLVSFIGTAHGAGTAILPLVLLGGRRVARSPGLASAALLTSALLLEILAGHPETLLHAVTLAIAYFFLEFVLVAAPEGWSRVSSFDSRRVLLSGFGAGIVALLLGAFVLLPLFEALPQTAEYRHRLTAGTGSVGGPGDVQLIRRLRVNVIPFLEGEQNGEDVLRGESIGLVWMASAYAGAVALPLMLFALLAVRDQRKWFLCVLFFWGILCGAGAPGVTSLLQHLPGFSVAVNVRMISFAALAVAALAAMGIDEAMRGRMRSLPALYIGLAIVIVPTAIALRGNLSTNFVRINTMREVLPLLLAATAALVFRAPRAAGTALLLLLVLQRATELGRTYPTVPQRAFFPEWPGLRTLPRGGEPYRVVGLANILTPNMATNYELEDVRGYQAMTFAPLAHTFPYWSVPLPVWSNRVDDLRSSFLSLMNVRYALVPPRMPIPVGWRTFGTYPDYSVLENLRALPRAFIPALIHRDAPDSLGAISRCQDFAREGWIDLGSAPLDIVDRRGVVSTRRDGTGLRLHASMAVDGWVIVTEPAWKGWNAIEVGHRLHLETADHAFLAFYLGRGEHDVILTYRPHSFVVGGAISLLAAMALAVAMIMQALPGRMKAEG